ncbi:hypothetical protein [Herbidospora yilanensis]|uniref:hypothetical protein n=1 Tax=Herbidospora yilanensis TaxID=354426 RepID=UPI000783C235|nr:hypothetical protein [Herbidospora yilanensis]
MRRTLAIAACATAVAAVTAVGAAPAQAAAPNPVAALKAQFKTGLGVKFNDKFLVGKEILTRRTGTLQFGRSGVAASDITTKLNMKASEVAEMPEDLQAMAKPEQVIKVGKIAYIKGGTLSALLPEGKTWVRFPEGLASGVTGQFGQLINPAEPATLQKLLKKSKRVGSVYAGKITYGDLHKTSKWLQGLGSMGMPTSAQKKSVLSYKLYVNAKGLVVRIVTTTSDRTFRMDGEETVTIDSRFVSWGAKVSVKAPTEDVAELDELDFSGAGLSSSLAALKAEAA